MLTGLAARAPARRACLFAAMAAAVWWFYATVGVMSCFPVFMATFANVAIAVLFAAFALEDPSARLRRRAPLTLWSAMADAHGVRVWMLLVWPLAIPAEVAIAALAGAVAILNRRLDREGDDA